MRLSETAIFRRLSNILPFSEFELATLILTAPSRYKEHYIEKRNGRGKRLISQPTSELKLLQRLLIQSELSQMKIHQNATAYRPGMSIYDHALPHAKSHFLLKLDFEDFFPSLKDTALKHRLSLDTNYTKEEIEIICRILFKKDIKSGGFVLSIGAPSSPFISNYLLNEFDDLICTYCKDKSLNYTRYADDIAISSNKPALLDNAKSYVETVLGKLSYLQLTLNPSKTVNVSKKYRRELVGLVLSNDGKVSLGREEKRRLRAAVNALAHGKLDAIAAAKLKGQLAFSMSIDKEFVLKLCRKYEASSVAELKQLTS